MGLTAIIVGTIILLQLYQKQQKIGKILEIESGANLDGAENAAR
jgi:hypothetical protein